MIKKSRSAWNQMLGLWNKFDTFYFLISFKFRSCDQLSSKVITDTLANNTERTYVNSDAYDKWVETENSNNYLYLKDFIHRSLYFYRRQSPKKKKLRSDLAWQTLRVKKNINNICAVRKQRNRLSSLLNWHILSALFGANDFICIFLFLINCAKKENAEFYRQACLEHSAKKTYQLMNVNRIKEYVYANMKAKFYYVTTIFADTLVVSKPIECCFNTEEREIYRQPCQSKTKLLISTNTSWRWHESHVKTLKMSVK